LAREGLRVHAYDIDPIAVEKVRSGVMPFEEPGAPELLEKVLADGSFSVSTDPGHVAGADTVVVVIGTPVDEHLNPDPRVVSRALVDLAPHLRDGQLILLRSTIYPGVTRLVDTELRRLGLAVDVAFCPERIAEGRALTELYELPQIV